jgi:hypothetical protein
MIGPMLIEGWRNTNIEVTEGYRTDVADLAGLFVFHPYHLAANFSWRVQLINARLTGHQWEKSVYLGLANLSLLVFALVFAFKNQKNRKMPDLSFPLGGMLFFILFAGGHSLHILGKPLRYFLLPTAVIEYLPFVSQLRTPSRAMVYVYLFLAIAISCIVANLFSENTICRYKWLRKPVLRDGMLTIIFLSIFLDFYSVAKDRTSFVCPKVYDVVTQDKTHSFGVLDLPIGYQQGNRYMAYQICHQRPIVFATISRKVGKSLIDTLDLDNLDRQKQQLIESGVKYIVIHKDGAGGMNRHEYERYVQTYRPVYSDQTGTVLQLK